MQVAFGVFAGVFLQVRRKSRITRITQTARILRGFWGCDVFRSVEIATVSTFRSDQFFQRLP